MNMSMKRFALTRPHHESEPNVNATGKWPIWETLCLYISPEAHNHVLLIAPIVRTLN